MGTPRSPEVRPGNLDDAALDGMAVFMAAYAKNQDDLFERPLSVSPDWQTMDVSLGLHYKLSDSLRFSLWGTHGYTPDARTKEDTGAGRRPPIDDVI